MNKKAIAILGAIFLLIVGTLGFLIYAKYSGNKSTSSPPTPSPVATTPTPSPSPSPAQTPSSTPVSQGGAVLLTSDQVVSPVLFFNGQGITYFDTSGNLYQATLTNSNGQLTLTDKKQLTVPQESGITKILWPTRGGDFIAESTDSATGKTSFSYFNSNAGSYTSLPPQVESVDWMPNGTQVVYIWFDGSKSSLSLGSPDTSNHSKLADIWENDDELHVSPDGSQILYFETSGSAASNAINSVTADGKVFKGLVKNGYNFGVQWSPDGQKFLFGKKDPTTQNYQLWVDNLTTGEIKNLGLFTTPDKAVWDHDSNTIYAAVPTSGSAGTGALTMDGFYSMDTSTLEKKQFTTGSAAIDGRDLFLSTDSSELFFKNAQDGGLYYLNLAQQ